MAAIMIDMKKVRNAGYELPPMMSNLSAQRRYINLLKWRIPSEIQDKRDIRERLHSIMQEMDRVEQMLHDIYEMTESALEQYKNTETNLTASAARFQ